jgi:hypothetical protein
MTPLGWSWAALVWGYAIAWALVNDRVKLLAYRVFDPAKAEPEPDAKAEPKPDAKAEPKPDAKAESNPDAEAESKPDAKAEPTPDAKAESKPDAKAESKPDAKSPSDLTPQLVKRVHKLYEELGSEDVRAVQEWEAEREKDAPAHR